MRRIKALGERYGRLIVSDEACPSSDGCRRVQCQCDCGNSAIIALRLLRSGRTQSCGCLRAQKRQVARLVHGHAGRSRTAEYRAWAKMLERCRNPRAKHYELYGGRGITVCERWAKSFEAFLSDIGQRPSHKHSLDRIDPNGNYEPENCRWATTTEQARNTRRTRLITVNGQATTIPDAIEASGHTVTRVLYRRVYVRTVLHGMEFDRAISASLQAHLDMHALCEERRIAYEDDTL